MVRLIETIDTEKRDDAMSTVVSKQKPTVYLAGPISNASDGGHGWRDEVIETYPDRFEWVNPLDHFDGDGTTVVPEGYGVPPDGDWIPSSKVVDGDKKLIRNSDAVLVGLREEVVSPGTAMEMIYSYDRGKAVGVWASPSVEKLAWRIEHCDIWTADMDVVLNCIENELQSKRAYD